MAEDKRKDKPARSAGTRPTPETDTPKPQNAKGQSQAPPQGARDASHLEEGDAASASAGEAGQSPAVVGVFEVTVLPLQQTTLFPATVVPLSAGRPRSVAAVEAALSTEEKLLACITVRDGKGGPEGEATPADIYEVGTLVTIKRMMRTPEGLQLIVHGMERVRVVEWTQTDPHLRAQVHALPALAKRDEETVEALMRN
ncbi:MAG: LON peptidase substrate-binding domain-containing protein, partial [Rubrivivax sp.]|nr:LON peptidase substrate-binding domain-containing protein [Pyrinomonadaceae bacterium]